MKPLLCSAAALLLCLGACGGSDPVQQPQETPKPTLTVAPGFLSLVPGDAPVTLTATLAHGTSGAEEIHWTLTGPGTLSSTTGATVTYSAPETLDGPTTARLEASAGEASAQVPVGLQPLSRRYFVDPSAGDDGHDGSEQTPFKTLTHALAVVRPGSTVMLEPGTYGTAGGEVWPEVDEHAEVSGIPVPAGVRLESVTPGEATLVAADGQTGLLFQAGGAVVGLTFQNFLIAISASGGPLELTSVTLQGGSASDATNLGLKVFGQNGPVQITCDDLTIKDLRCNGTGMYLQYGAAVTLKGGSISGDWSPSTTADASCRGATGINILNGALQMTGVQLSHLKEAGIDAREGSTVFVKQGGMSQLGIAVNLSDDASIHLKGLSISEGSIGIYARSAQSTVALRNVTIASQSDDAVYAAGRLLIDQSTLQANTTGVELDHNPASAVLTDVTFQDGTTGIDNRGGSLYLRGSNFSSVEVAVKSAYDGTNDLGKVSDQGENTFHATDTNVDVGGSGGPQTVWAVGNTWWPNVQGADASGHYATQALAGPQDGKNFNLSSTETIQF